MRAAARVRGGSSSAPSVSAKVPQWVAGRLLDAHVAMDLNRLVRRFLPHAGVVAELDPNACGARRLQ